MEILRLAVARYGAAKIAKEIGVKREHINVYTSRGYLPAKARLVIERLMREPEVAPAEPLDLLRRIDKLDSSLGNRLDKMTAVLQDIADSMSKARGLG